jgi:DNA-binding NarL/FixJ family response regulator
MVVVGDASTKAQALGLAEKLRPDVTLVDIYLGGESGLEVAHALSTAATPVLVILISTHAEDDFGGLIAASPAIGFLPKAALSASAIRDMIAHSGHLTSADEIRGPTGS